MPKGHALGAHAYLASDLASAEVWPCSRVPRVLFLNSLLPWCRVCSLRSVEESSVHVLSVSAIETLEVGRGRGHGYTRAGQNE